jgi:hypothetical protein
MTAIPECCRSTRSPWRRTTWPGPSASTAHSDSQVEYGDERAAFTSFAVAQGHLNLMAEPPERRWSWWGRVIVSVEDVDALYTHARTQDLEPSAVPRDAP